MPSTYKATFIILLAGCWGCNTNIDAQRSSDRTRLLELHHQQQRAHLNYNAELFAAMYNEPIIQLNHGRIAYRSRQESITRIRSYFDRVEFLEWSNIDPPVVRISQDGSMAYIIVHKRVRLRYEDEAGETQEEHTVFAWLEAWEKVAGEWRLMAAASTDRPGGG